jgi:asparagine synthase (glutamine-hydrolysing)
MEQDMRGLVQDFCLPSLLRYADRNSMAFSVEARVPFTDFRIVEFAFSGALDGHKISHGWPKWVLREAGKGLVQEDILWRRDKMGFGTPESEYVRTLAQSWINRGQKFERSAGWLRIAEADAIIHRTAAGTTRNRVEEGMALRLMGVETWLQAFQLYQAAEV